MITVGIGDYAISNDISKKIITHSLGSCVAVIFYCPNNQYAAMAHIALPNIDNRNKSTNKMAYYADMFLPHLINDFTTMMTCPKSELEVTLVGGADSRNKNDLFQIGSRNLETIRRMLKHHQIPYNDTETGGHFSRTVDISIKTGRIHIKRQKMIV